MTGTLDINNSKTIFVQSYLTFMLRAWQTFQGPIIICTERSEECSNDIYFENQIPLSVFPGVD